MPSTLTADDRAVSTVVAAAMLVAITVLLATAIGLVVTDLDVSRAKEPSVTLSFEVVSNQVEMTHEGGETLEADEVVVLDENGAPQAGLSGDLQAGQSETIVTNASSVDRVTVVWQDPTGETEAVLATFEL